MKKIALALLAFVLTVPTASAQAQENDCDSIVEDIARLACYDSINRGADLKEELLNRVFNPCAVDSLRGNAGLEGSTDEELLDLFPDEVMDSLGNAFAEQQLFQYMTAEERDIVFPILRVSCTRMVNESNTENTGESDIQSNTTSSDERYWARRIWDEYLVPCLEKGAVPTRLQSGQAAEFSALPQDMAEARLRELLNSCGL